MDEKNMKMARKFLRFFSYTDPIIRTFKGMDFKVDLRFNLKLRLFKKIEYT